jgi:hypothetical protein
VHLQILQFQKVRHRLPRTDGTPDITLDDQQRAAEIVAKDADMEVGYYDLELVDQGTVFDHTIEIK